MVLYVHATCPYCRRPNTHSLQTSEKNSVNEIFCYDPEAVGPNPCRVARLGSHVLLYKMELLNKEDIK